MLSSQGFLALQQEDIPTFVTYLEKAHQLAPWEPYYPYQLGWNLGELAFHSTDVQQQSKLAEESVKWFEKAIALSPHREFGYTNLGWLLVNTHPEKATAAFLQAIQLAPHKEETYFALGYSLLKENRPELAIQALTIALARDPVLLTSPVWQSPDLATAYPKVLDSFETYLNTQISDRASDKWQQKAYQTKGMLHWWKGEYDLAKQAFSHNPTSLNQVLLTLSESHYGDETAIAAHNELKTNPIVAIWAQSAESRDLLFKSTLSRYATITTIDESALSSLFADINSTFYTWLTQDSPSYHRRTQRLGFGTISRHIDGPLPQDFSATADNILVADYFSALLSTPASSSDTIQLHKGIELTLHDK